MRATGAAARVLGLGRRSLSTLAGVRGCGSPGQSQWRLRALISTTLRAGPARGALSPGAIPQRVVRTRLRAGPKPVTMFIEGNRRRSLPDPAGTHHTAISVVVTMFIQGVDAPVRAGLGAIDGGVRQAICCKTSLYLVI